MSQQPYTVFDQDDIQNNKTMAGLACIPILFWVPWVSCPDSKFA